MKTRERLMNGLADFVIRYSQAILLVALGLVVLAFFGIGNIQIKTQMRDVIGAGNPRVEALEEIDRVFRTSSLILTVEGRDKRRLAEAAEELAREIEESEMARRYLKAVNLKLDRSFVDRWGLLLQKPDELQRTRELFSRLNLLPFLTGLNDSLESAYTGEEAGEDLETARQEAEAVAAMSQIESLAEQLRAYVEEPEIRPVDETARSLAETMVYGDLYSFSPDGTMLLFVMTTNVSLIEDMETASRIMEGVRVILADMEKAYPDLDFGYTGEVGLQADENAAVAKDLTLPSILACIAVLVLFLLSFNQIRAILFAMFSLIFGILYTFGIVGLVLGEINLVTSIGTALLIGLGIDYGIQMITSFTSFRQAGHSPEEAVRLTFQRSGIGIVLAASTTAASFFVLIVSASKGVSQLGIVAGLGILSCLLVMILVLPSLLLLFGRRDRGGRRLPQVDYRFLEAAGTFAARHRVPVLAVTAVLTAGLLLAAVTGLQAEFDVLALEPQSAPSVRTHRRILEKFEINPMTATVMAGSLGEARTLTEALERKTAVGEVQSITALLPPADDQAARLAEIALLRESPPVVTETVYSATDVELLAQEIQRLEWNMIELGDLSVAGLGEDNKILRKRNAMVREIFGAETGRAGKEVFQSLIAALLDDPERSAARLSRLDGPFARNMEEIVHRMMQADRPITVEDLPESVARSFLDEAKTHNLITIYPRAGVTDTEAGLRRFDAALRDVSPRITGVTPITLDFFDEMLHDSRRAALLVGALVLLFTFLSFRNFWDMLAASMPVAVSLVLLFGTLALVGLKLTPMNLITLPLVIGIGIAYGTYLTQRFLVEDRDLGRGLRYTVKAIFLSAFTTMAGFGSLGLAGSFRMLTTFGTVLFLGIACCLLATIIVLPALLSLRKTKDLRKELP